MAPTPRARSSPTDSLLEAAPLDEELVPPLQGGPLGQDLLHLEELRLRGRLRDPGRLWGGGGAVVTGCRSEVIEWGSNTYSNT